MASAYVFLHGFSGSHASWHAVVARLPRAARVFLPDLAGHANAPAPTSFEGEVARLALAIASSGLSDAHLVGYSLGARLALGLLAYGVPQVARATLVGVHPGLATAAERAARIAQDDAWAELIEERGVAAFVDAWEANPIFASQKFASRAAIESQRSIRGVQSAPALGAAMRALSLGRMPNYWPVLSQLEQPIRLLTGALDIKFTQLAAEALPLLRRGSQHVERGVGHNVLLERPEVVLTEVD